MTTSVPHLIGVLKYKLRKKTGYCNIKTHRERMNVTVYKQLISNETTEI